MQKNHQKKKLHTSEDSLVVNILLLLDQGILLLGIYLKELRTHATQKHAHGCLQQFSAHLSNLGHKHIFSGIFSVIERTQLSNHNRGSFGA